MSYNKLASSSTGPVVENINQNLRLQPLNVALVIPTHNEEKLIESSINSLEQYISSLNDHDYNISILIAEDGSTDNTIKIANTLVAKYKNIILRHNPVKLGRGRAVKEAWKAFDANVYAYVDADMAAKLDYIDKLLESCGNGYEIVTGSRYLEYSDVKRPFLRKKVSQVYNHLINKLFHTTVKDHQCGFKAVTKNARSIILEESIFDDWFWDTEVFVIARNKGLSVFEFPIEWQENRGSKTPLRRLLKDMWIHGMGIVKLMWKTSAKLSYLGFNQNDVKSQSKAT